MIVRRYNTTALCNTAGTGTLRYGGQPFVDQSQESVAHPSTLRRHLLRRGGALLLLLQKLRHLFLALVGGEEVAPEVFGLRLQQPVPFL